MVLLKFRVKNETWKFFSQKKENFNSKTYYLIVLRKFTSLKNKSVIDMVRYSNALILRIYNNGLKLASIQKYMKNKRIKSTHLINIFLEFDCKIIIKQGGIYWNKKFNYLIHKNAKEPGPIEDE